MNETTPSVAEAFDAFTRAQTPDTLAAYNDAVAVARIVRAAAERSFQAFIAARLGDLLAERVAKRARLAAFLTGARERLAAKRAASPHPTDAITLRHTRQSYRLTLQMHAAFWSPNDPEPKEAVAAASFGSAAPLSWDTDYEAA